MKKHIGAFICMALLLLVAACKGANPPMSPSPDGENTTVSGQSATHTPTAANTASPASAPLPTPDSSKKSTLVLSMYGYDPYLEDAKKAYEKIHPNITIDLQYVTKEFDGSGLLVEKFRTKTNADFLSGKGADLVVMDDLPADHFIGNRMLANLSELMERDPAFQKEAYFQNVLDNVKESDGNVYAMPLGFYVSGLMADQKALQSAGVEFDDSKWKWEQFEGIVQKLLLTAQYGYGYVAKQPEHLLYDWVNSAYSQLVDQVNRKAYFNTDRFIGLMNDIKEMEAQKVISFDFKNFENVYFQQMDIYSVGDYITRMKTSKFVKPALYDAPKAEGQQDGSFFTTVSNIAINGNSAVKPEAWDFLKFLMSGEGRSSDKEIDASLSWYNTLPVSKSAYEARVKEMSKGGSFTEADIQPLTEFISNARNQKTRMPGEIEIVFFKETPAFFSGQKSAQAVGDIIQNKAMTYLNE